jgi:hypothetical protein
MPHNKLLYINGRPVFFLFRAITDCPGSEKDIKEAMHIVYLSFASFFFTIRDTNTISMTAYIIYIIIKLIIKETLGGCAILISRISTVNTMPQRIRRCISILLSTLCPLPPLLCTRKISSRPIRRNVSGMTG